MNGSDLFVRCLEAEGVDHVFGLPGEENLDLLESLRRSEKIRLVVTRHEQHAAFMAATYGRLTGKAGVCLSTLGPGATNLTTGIAQAQLAGYPLVALTAQKPAVGNWQGNFQLLDIVDVMRPLTKWNAAVSSTGSIPRCLRHAFQTAQAERPGAVHVELPEDVGQKKTDEPVPDRRADLPGPLADPRVLEAAADELRAARWPLVVVSGGANRADVCGPLARFAEQTGIHVVATQMGKGALPEDHERSLFCLAIHQPDYVHVALERADLVVTVGYDVAEYPPAVWNPNKDKRILHVDAVQAEPDEYYLPQLEVVGSVGRSLESLASLVGNRTAAKEMSRLRGFLQEQLFERPPETGYPPTPRRVVQAARRALEREDIVCLDNGIYKIWFARHYPALAPDTVLLDNALATMGAGLATGMAAKLLRPDRRVLAVCGDGGFVMNAQDLETAVRLDLDLVVLILRDDAFGFIRWKQRAMGLPDHAMDFGNPDFVRLAEAYGARGLAVREGDELESVLAEALSTPGPVVIDCPIDYGPNEELSGNHAQLARDFLSAGRS